MLNQNIEEAVTLVSTVTQDHAVLDRLHRNMEAILPHTYESVYSKRPLPFAIKNDLSAAYHQIGRFSGLTDHITHAKELLIGPDDLQTQIVYSTLRNVLFESKSDNLKKLDDTTSRFQERKSYDIDKLSALKRLVLAENYAIYALAVSSCIESAYAIETVMEYRQKHGSFARMIARLSGSIPYRQGEVPYRIERIDTLYPVIKRNFDLMFSTTSYHLLYAQNDLWLTLHGIGLDDE